MVILLISDLAYAMTYSDRISHIGQDIEGEVTLLVNGIELTCFSNMPPALSLVSSSKCNTLNHVRWCTWN